MAAKNADREKLETWLNDQPVDWAPAIATRCALRVFPLALSLDRKETNYGRRAELWQELVLQLFRTNLISWAACKYPSHQIAGWEAANAAIDTAHAVHATYTAYATVDAARAAAAAAHSDAKASRAAAAAEAADAAVAAARTSRANGAAYASAAAAATAMWNAVESDCRWLEENGDGLIELPLWPIDGRGDPKFKTNLPPWAREAFDAFVGSSLAKETSFGLIVDWYRAILPSDLITRSKSLFGEIADVRIATMPATFWAIDRNRSATRIMDEVAGIWGWRRPRLQPRPTVAEFIVGFLDGRDQPASIDDIREAFRKADYSVVDKTMRGELSRLALAGVIVRVRIGIYTSTKNSARLVEDAAPPTMITQGVGPTFAAIDGKLSRIPHYPLADEANNLTLQKLLARIKKRLPALIAGFRNSLAQYPQLADVLGDYGDAVECDGPAGLDIDDLWISGVGLISQARAFAALDPTKQVTEPLEPQLQALLGEIARLHGALIMGFAKGRLLAEQSGIPLLTAEEFKVLIAHEKAIVRWLLESEQFEMSDKARALFSEVDRLLFSTGDSAENLATSAYPVIRNVLIFVATGLSYAEKTAGRLSLSGIPVSLAVAGMVPFFKENLGPIMAFASSVPELRGYLEYHLNRLEIEWQRDNNKDGGHSGA